jgi:hypothetical protein
MVKPVGIHINKIINTTLIKWLMTAEVRDGCEACLDYREELGKVKQIRICV